MSKRKRDARDPYRNSPSWEEREDRFEAHPFREALKWCLGIFAIVVILVALVGVVSTGSVFWQGEKAKITNPAREKVIVFDPNRTLSTYEGFYQSCNQFNADLASAKDAEGEAAIREKSYDPKADTFGNDRKSITAVREDARALRNHARTIAASYNADSAANTRAPFKAADLPYTLDAQGREAAQCGTSKEATR